MLERMGRKGNTPPLLVGVQIRTAILSIRMTVSQENGSQYIPGLCKPLLGPYQNDLHPCNKDMSLPMFVATLFEVARNCKQRRCPSSEEWIKKMWHIYTMEYYSAGGKKWNLEIHRKINGS